MIRDQFDFDDIPAALKSSGGGSTLITYRGVDLVVTYDYTAEEPAEHYGDAPYPGCPASLDVLEVHHKGEDILELFDWHALEDIGDKVMEELR